MAGPGTQSEGGRWQEDCVGEIEPLAWALSVIHWMEGAGPMRVRACADTSGGLAGCTLVSRKGPMNISYSRRESAPYCRGMQRTGMGGWGGWARGLPGWWAVL